MSGDQLARNPVLIREMEVRAAGDDGYRVFNYAGPGLYLLLLQIPVLYGLMSAAFGWNAPPDVWCPELFLVTAWLQVLYFSHAAARFCAGSMAVERERGTIDALRLVPRPSRDLFVGKYLASIAPLLVEAVAAVPFLALYSLFGSVSLVSVVLVGAFDVALIGLAGFIGMYWSLQCRDVLSAVSHAFLTVLALNVLPLVAGGFLRLSQDTLCRPLLGFSPLYVCTGLVHTGTVGVLAVTRDLAVLTVWVALGAGFAVLLYRASLRRLAGR